MRHATMMVVILLMTILACTATEDKAPVTDLTSSPFHSILAEAKAAAAKANRNIVIDFYVDW